jgi:uncharacterized protein DUF929
MGRPGSARDDSGRRERIAAQRAATRRAQARNRLFLAGGAIVVVIVIVVVLLVFRGNSPSPAKSAGPANPAGSALTQLIMQTTTVPQATLDKVGGGQVTAKPTPITGPPLTSGGRPEMLYVGAEYCPYCAAERWAMIVALSRFGTFSGLATTHSAAKNGAGNAEPFPNTPTWTFAHASYTSKFLAFTPVEELTNIPDTKTGGYTPLQTPTSAEQALVSKYDAPPNVPAQDAGAIPFVDFGNKFLTVGASYDPGVLRGLTWNQIANDLRDPASPVAKGVLGTANYMTAAICGLTSDQPAAVCTAGIKSLQSQL